MCQTIVSPLIVTHSALTAENEAKEESEVNRKVRANGLKSNCQMNTLHFGESGGVTLLKMKKFEMKTYNKTSILSSI